LKDISKYLHRKTN